MGVALSVLDRRIAALAVPALGALVIEPLYNLTDTAVVGHLGRDPLGGLAVASTVLNLLGWTSGFLQMATTSQVAYQRGRDDEAAATSAAVAAYVVAVVLGVVVAVVVAAVGPVLAHALTADRQVAENAATYLRISAVGMPFLLLTLAGTGHAQGHEDARTPLRIVVVANLVNIALELLLVYGAGAGIAGSAWGTVVAQVVAAALFLGSACRRLLRPIVAPPRATYVVLLRDGLALVVRTVALGSALVASTAIAARVGSATLGGHQIAMQVWLLLALTLDALALPAQVFVGNALGRGDVAEARLVGDRCLRVGLTLGVVAGVLTAALAPVLPRIFTDDPAVQGRALLALLVCGLLQPAAAAAFVLDGLLLGAGQYAVLRRAMIGALFAFAPLAVATILHHPFGIVGIWLALTCWLAARWLLLGVRWRSESWAPTAAT